MWAEASTRPSGQAARITTARSTTTISNDGGLLSMASCMREIYTVHNEGAN